MGSYVNIPLESGSSWSECFSTNWSCLVSSVASWLKGPPEYVKPINTCIKISVKCIPLIAAVTAGSVNGGFEFSLESFFLNSLLLLLGYSPVWYVF